MSKRVFRIIIPFGILILFLVKVVPEFLKDSNCGVAKVFFESFLNGTVTRKYIDSGQHSYKTLIIKNFDSQEVKMDYFDFDTTNFYILISVGDSVYKKMASDSVFKYESGHKVFFFKPYFGCTPH
jgi:hypothetical protein